MRPVAILRQVDDAARKDLAQRLIDAAATRTAIDPPSADHPGMTLDDAYAVQLLQVERWLSAGQRIVGHKVGLTSAAMQAQLGVDRPDYGHLTDRMVHAADAVVPVAAYLQPRVEPEVALVLRHGLAGPGVTVVEALAAVDVVLPSLEIIDSRVRDWRITLLDTVADNASSGGVVLGAGPRRPADVDLELGGCVLRRNGEIVGTGAGAAVLGSPVHALAWLANTLGERGVALEPGHVVLPGSITAAVPVRPGDIVTAQFAGLGTVTARFA